jgi:thioredoxin reductase (NADPH)
MSAILVVVSDQERRATLTEALSRRFGADYGIFAVEPAELPATLESSGPVAAVLAPIGSDDFESVGVVGASHHTAKRIAIVGVGDTSVTAALSLAMTLGHVDYYVGYPWASPDEELYPVVSEALRLWAHDNRLRFEKVTIVDDDRHEGAVLASLLDRNSVATKLHVADSPEGRALLDGPLADAALPAVLLWDGRVLAAPTAPELVAALGVRTNPVGGVYDVTVVGGGPAGLAAAVYAASEGLRTVMLEVDTVGGQAGTSTKIRNYLGFPWGVRGADLAQMAHRQAEQLGAEIVATRRATGLDLDGEHILVMLSNNEVIRTRRVVLAGGVTYRRIGVESVDALIGRGVFYGAAAGEASSMAGLRVFVLGGGNSAGQAAAHLAKAGATVTVLVRRDSLNHSMSGYLITQLEGTPNLTIRCNTRVTDAVGDQQLEALELEDSQTGARETVPADALFVFIGAVPRTEWLEGVVRLDDHGFVATGQDGAEWLETSRPGVYAAGDIRSGSIKRVAAAVGEGSTASMLVRESLTQAAAAPPPPVP